MTQHDQGAGGLRHKMSGIGRFARLSAAAGIVVVGAGLFQVSSSDASNSAAPPTQPSAGQLQQQGTAVNNLYAAAPAGYKQQLEQQFMQIASTADKYPADYQRHAALVARAQDAVRAINTLTDQQVAVLYSIFSTTPGWSTLASNMASTAKNKAHVLAAISHVKSAGAHLRAHDGNSDFNPNPPNDCETTAFGNAIYGLIAAHIVAQGTATALERVAESLPDSEVVGAVIAGEGDIFTLPVSPEREIAEDAVLAADLIAQAADGAKELMEECNQDDFQADMEAFKNYAHSFIPVKSVVMKVVPISGGTQFYLTAALDGLPVLLNTGDSTWKVYALTPGTTPKETDITSMVTVTTIDSSNGVYILGIPGNISASGFVLKADTTQDTDPTSGTFGSTTAGQSHTGVVTFTRTGL